MRRTALVWYHLDLRVGDHPALHAAVAEADYVVPVFIWAPEEAGAGAPGAARRWWLHHSLTALAAEFQKAGAPLIIRQGPSLETLRSLIHETNADAVYWHQRYEPEVAQRDDGIQEALAAEGIACNVYEGTLLHNPDQIRTNAGDPYKVFTPFWKKLCAQLDVSLPLPAPTLKPYDPTLDSEGLDALELLPNIDWAGGLRATWMPGEAGGHARLATFLDQAPGYLEQRNIPSTEGTSRLSPYLCHGEVSARQIWHAMRAHHPGPLFDDGYLREIAWREFAYHVLFHFPHTIHQPLKPKYSHFPWRDDPAFLAAWQRGRTGFPIVDAGMRQLWHTGWMHNRVRMIVASFLTKDGLVPWQAGAAWFWDTLVDADLASNTMGWQWAAGCGADAQPFFRIFNPTSQGQKFDQSGTYVRAWVSEIASLPSKELHHPWTIPAMLLATAGVTLGETYPAPLVDHSAARKRALEALQQMNEKT